MKILIIIIPLFLFGCIGTDIVDDKVPPRVVIQNPIDSLKVGETHQFMARFLDETGQEAPAFISWTSTNEQSVSITNNGLASALQPGVTEIIASYQMVADTVLLASGEKTTAVAQTRTASLMSVSAYPLSGSASLEKEQNGSLYLRFSSNFNTTSALPGLYVYLSNNVNTTANAYEIGAVEKFSGAQQYLLSASVSISDYDFVLFFCKPFNVPVGNGQLMP